MKVSHGSSPSTTESRGSPEKMANSLCGSPTATDSGRFEASSCSREMIFSGLAGGCAELKSLDVEGPKEESRVLSISIASTSITLGSTVVVWDAFDTSNSRVFPSLRGGGG